MAHSHPEGAGCAYARSLELTLLALVSIGVLLLLTLGHRPNPVDDAYITFTYAKNLASGNGLVFTPGEHTFGSTTPLYALLLALIGLVGHPLAMPAIALCVNALALIVTAFLAYRLLRLLMPEPRVAAPLTALLLLLNPKLHAACIGGMEGPLFILLTLLAIDLAVRHRESALM